MKESILNHFGLKTKSALQHKGSIVQKTAEAQVGIHNNKIVIIFEQPITSVEFTKLEALDLIQAIGNKLPLITK